MLQVRHYSKDTSAIKVLEEDKSILGKELRKVSPKSSFLTLVVDDDLIVVYKVQGIKKPQVQLRAKMSPGVLRFLKYFVIAGRPVTKRCVPAPRGAYNNKVPQVP